MILSKKDIQKLYKICTGYVPWNPVLRSRDKYDKETFNRLKLDNKKYMLKEVIKVCKDNLGVNGD